MVEQETKLRLLRSEESWKFELKKDGQVLIFVDTHGLLSAKKIVERYFDEGTSMREEKCHLDKSKTLIVVLLEGHNTESQLRRLSNTYGRLTRLYCAYVIQKWVMQPANWTLCADGFSMECNLPIETEASPVMAAVAKAKNEILVMLHEKLKIPASGYLYFGQRYRRTYRLVWHSCSVCDAEPSWCEFPWSRRCFARRLLL